LDESRHNTKGVPVTAHRYRAALLSVRSFPESELLVCSSATTRIFLSQPQQMDEEEAPPSCSSGSSEDNPTGQSGGNQPVGLHRSEPMSPDGVGTSLGENASTTISLSIVGDSSLLTMVDPQSQVELNSRTATPRGTSAPDARHSSDEILLIVEEVLDLLEDCHDHQHPRAVLGHNPNRFLQTVLVTIEKHQKGGPTCNCIPSLGRRLVSSYNDSIHQP
jgi:hypothetical protein